MSRYAVPKQTVRVETMARNSRFITTVQRVSSAAEAHDRIRDIRAEMPDASHHVYAFKIGYGASVQEGVSDDGEPSGTSGPPTLAVLRGADIGDTLVVTTRYFGGTKLGTGGLVAAYTAAAQAGLAAVATEEKVARVDVVVDVPYALLEPVRRILPNHEARIDNEEFAAAVRLHLSVPAEFLPALEQSLRDLSGGQVHARVPGNDSEQAN